MNNIKNTISQRGKVTQDENEMPVSLLTDTYPHAWILDHLGVGRKATSSANDRAVAFGPGSTVPKYSQKKISPRMKEW